MGDSLSHLDDLLTEYINGGLIIILLSNWTQPHFCVKILSYFSHADEAIVRLISTKIKE